MDQIESGDLALVEFQRDFDWSLGAIRSLLATVLMGWPAGSLLAIDGRGRHLARRSFDGGPDASRANTLILDGQQRLTTLLHAARGELDRQYWVPLSALETGNVDEIEDKIFVGGSQERDWTDELGEIRVPLRAARSADAFFEWRDSITLFVGPQADDLKRRLSQVYRDHLHWLHDYSFPVVSLGTRTDDDAVARIFERVNRNGLRLGTFDLVVSRAAADGWDLRSLWDETRISHPRVARYFEDGLVVLQVIALVHEGNVRQSAIRDLEPALIRREWASAAQGLANALAFFEEQCGVGGPEFVPYPVLPLLFAAISMVGAFTTESVELRRLFFLSAFTLRYDAAANTRVVGDFFTLRDGFSVEHPNVRLETLESSTRQRQSAVTRALLCYLRQRGVQDLAGEPLRWDAADSDMRPVVISVIPRDADTRLHLRAASFVWASPQTAVGVSNGLGFDGDQLSLPGSDETLNPMALKSQFVPSDPSPRRDPESFVRERASLMLDAIESDFGSEAGSLHGR